MGKTRLEAFTDAVIAILITLMVLEIDPPIHAVTFMELQPIFLNVIVYIFSFILLAMYWNNYHNLFHGIQKISGKVLWINNIALILFSAIPFATKWLAEHFTARDPQLLYGVIILLSDLVWHWMTSELIKTNKDNNNLRVHHHSAKMRWTLIMNVIALVAGLFVPVLVIVINAISIGRWLIPDKQLEGEK